MTQDMITLGFDRIIEKLKEQAVSQAARERRKAAARKRAGESQALRRREAGPDGRPPPGAETGGEAGEKAGRQRKALLQRQTR